MLPCSLLPANVACESYDFTHVCHSVRGWGGCYSSMHCRWYPSMPCSRSPGGWYPSMPCRFPGPHPGGKLRGIWVGGVSRPTPKGEVEGDLARGCLQAHTWGGSPGPLPGGCLQAHTSGVSKPTLGGVYPSMH